MANDGFYEIATAFPEMTVYYALLAGLFYKVPYATMGLLGGTLTKSSRRIVIVASLALCASGTIFLNGVAS